MILHYFFTPAWIKSVAEELKLWGVITMAFAIVLGVMNIARVNLKIAWSANATGHTSFCCCRDGRHDGGRWLPVAT